MKIRTLIVPAAAALLSASGLALAQAPDQQPAPAAQPAEQQAAPKSAQPAAVDGKAADEPAPGEMGTAQEQISIAEKAAAAAKEAAASAPPRTPEQAAIAKEIAKNAPKRDWRMAALGPAQKATVMYPQTGKKVSDVSIIASVDQRTRLELLDITGSGASDSLRMPTSGPKFVNETSTASAEEAGAASAGSTSPRPALSDAPAVPASSAGAAVAPDVGAPAAATPQAGTTEPAPETQPQE